MSALSFVIPKVKGTAVRIISSDQFHARMAMPDSQNYP